MDNANILNFAKIDGWLPFAINDSEKIYKHKINGKIRDENSLINQYKNADFLGLFVNDNKPEAGTSGIETLKKQFIKEARNILPCFKVDDGNREKISLLFNYFNNFESELDLKKSILVCGDVGTGKTILLRAFECYTEKYMRQNKFKIYDIPTIISDLDEKGLKGISCLYSNLNGFGVEVMQSICIDELNEFTSFKSYGNTYNFMDLIIQRRYTIFQNYGYKTHITTNLTLEEIMNKLDFRVRDRLKELCNIVEMKGASRRK